MIKDFWNNAIKMISVVIWTGPARDGERNWAQTVINISIADEENRVMAFTITQFEHLSGCTAAEPLLYKEWSAQSFKHMSFILDHGPWVWWNVLET